MRGGAGIRAGARGGNSGPARGVRGFGARSAGWGGDSSPARSGVEIRSRARGGRNSGPSAGWGGKFSTFLPFFRRLGRDLH